jgi:S-methylmethionine-dependent homocysteine/selenocysteine methylase
MPLIERLAKGDVLVLDGANGTELEVRGAPKTSDAAWADCSATHPEIVCAVHEDYIRAGADIITTNTYSTGPHVLRQMGRDEVIAPWNIASVELARKAVAQAAPDRKVLIAGSASAYGNGAMRYASVDGQYTWSEDDLGKLSANFHEQLSILADAGVDILQLEFLGATANDIEAVVPRALELGLPVIVSLSATVDDKGTAILTDVSSGSTVDAGTDTVSQAVRRISGSGITAICAMHSEIDEIDTILPAIRAEWSGPLGAYPNRTGFWDGREWVFTEEVTPQAYADRAKRWAGLGATIIGGCCGTTPAMIAAVSEILKR